MNPITIIILKRFNKKQLAVLVLALPVGMTSCSDNKTTPQEVQTAAVLRGDSMQITDTLNSEVKLMVERQVVVERVRDIFGLVKAHQLKTGGLSPEAYFDKAFCSEAWNKMLMGVKAKEYETNTLFFEIDYWLMTRNIGLVTFDEFECTSLYMEDNKKHATVDFLAYEADTSNPARVDLVFEDGRWVIDNFYDMRFHVNVHTSMLEYIAKDVL